MEPNYYRLFIDGGFVTDTEVDLLSALHDLCMWLFFSGIERTSSQ